MASPEVATPRPLRADAARNRAAILKAARAVFAKYGSDAQMDDIARRAKVGVGTVYRHFPTKAALFQALANDHFEQVTEIAREASQVDDPWEAFEQMMLRSAELMAADRAMAEVMAADPTAMTQAKQRQQELFTLGDEILRRGQAAGVIRPDAVTMDIGIVMSGLCATTFAPHLPPDAWRRQLRLALDGFRGDGRRTPITP